MKTFIVNPATAAWLVAGVLAFGLCGGGCHSNATAPAASMPAGVAPIDSSKPPPEMQALHQRTDATKSGSGQTGASTP